MNEDELSRFRDEAAYLVSVMNKSEAIAAIISEEYLRDPLCMLQLGAAIMMNKPIIILVLDGVRVPKKVKEAADIIKFVSVLEPSGASKALKEAMDELALGPRDYKIN